MASAKSKKASGTCGCRPARSHRDCAYCGYGGTGIRVCGACRAEGIDGPVIPGTSAVVCAVHRVKTKEVR